MDPIAALFVGAAAIMSALLGWQQLKRDKGTLNESRLARNVDQLEDMLSTYEKDRARFLQELERERGKVERLEQELQEERDRAGKIIETKQQQLDESLRKIAILEHQKADKESQIQELRNVLKRHIGGPGEEFA